MLGSFIEGNKVQFVIPVYQRKYDWTTENCDQLFNDLARLSRTAGRKVHFFGSVVTSPADGYGFNRLVIDGQQRLTTVSLLLLAGIKAAREGAIAMTDGSRIDEAFDVFLNAKYCSSERKIKLVPIESDRKAYDSIYHDDEEHFDIHSKMTVNFRHFYQLLTAEPQAFSFDGLLDAIERLEIITIELEQGDDAQLIFESLNSTGLALQEGDKVRNYMLMSLTAEEQKQYFVGYWQKMETLLGDDLTLFLRDYLTIREQLKRPVRQNNIYTEWKKYMEGKDRKSELSQMLDYAAYYRKVTHATLSTDRLSQKMRHICNIGSDVANSFFVQFLRYADQNQLSADEVYRVIDVIENFMARRIVCNMPGNALTQVFCALHRDVMRSMEEYCNAGLPMTCTYSDILSYHILRRDGNYGIPHDTQFVEAIRTRDAYHMLKPFQIFLFERLENAMPGEYNDVATEMRNKQATIEHIMPQTLSREWKEMLGDRWEEVQERYLHTFANLTLTGINSELSNKPFNVKRDGKREGDDIQPGYKDSKYRMTRDVTLCDKWTKTEIEHRADKMVSTFLKLYPMLTTTFKPLPKPVEEVSLNDETFSPTGRLLKGFRLWGVDYDYTAWKSMLLQVVRLVMGRYPDIVNSLYDKEGFFWTSQHADTHYCTKLEDDKYLWTSMDNRSKLRCLRYLFEKCGIDESELVFLLEPVKPES